MTFLPLVQRELAVAARRKSTFRLRSWTAVIAMVVSFCSLFFLWVTSGRGNVGAPLFTIVTHYAFGICLLAGPLLTADCLSQEKREGTLGLLFLTDLKGYDVVLGKFVAKSLNAFYGLFALLPIIALPLMLGGVTSGEFWRTALALGNTLFISLAAGIFVSTLTRDSRGAMGRTLLLVLLLAGVLPALAEFSLLTPGSPLLSCLAWISPLFPFSFAREAAHAGQPARFWTSLVCSNLLACFFLALSSRLLPQRWQAGTRVRDSESLISRFLRRGRRNEAGKIKLRQRLLEINPVLWLMGDVPGLRWLTWVIVLGWGAFLLVANLISPRAVLWGGYSGATICGFLLKVLVAVQACRFFAEARQSGSLELLLCTPIRDGEILKGQWIALKGLFLWPFVAFLLLSFVVPAASVFCSGPTLSQIVSSAFGFIFGSLAFVWFTIDFVADNFAVIWFGMWLALTMKKPQLAPAATILLVLVLPICVNKLADIFFILWGAIKLQQNLRWIVAQQYQRAISHGPSAGPPNVPPIIRYQP